MSVVVTKRLCGLYHFWREKEEEEELGSVPVLLFYSLILLIVDERTNDRISVRGDVFRLKF